MKTSGEILKEIRVNYKLSQQDCAGKNIDRSLLSRIEKGEYALTEDVAIKLALNINTKLKVKDINETIDPLIFFEDKYNNYLEAKLHLNSLNTYLSNKDVENFDTQFHILDEIFQKYNLPEIKMRVLEASGQMAIIKNDFNKANEYLIRALDCAFIIGDKQYQLKLYLIMCNPLSRLGKFSDMSYICNLLINNYDIEFYKEKIYYNLAYAQSKMKNFETALYYFSKINILSDINKIADIQLHKAICLKNLRRHNESLDILFNILNQFKNMYSDKVINAYNLIINNYIKLNEREIVFQFCNLLTDYLDNFGNDLYILQEVYYELGKAFEYLKLYYLAEEYYLKLLKSSQNSLNYALQNKSIKHLLDNYDKTNIVHNENFLNMLISLSDKSKLENYNTRRAYRILYNLFKNRQIKECDELLTAIHIKIKERRNINEEEDN